MDRHLPEKPAGLEPGWDVVIVGGGFTGVTAAEQVKQHWPEARVLLLEGAESLGGRALTTTVEVPLRGRTELRADQLERSEVPFQTFDVG